MTVPDLPVEAPQARAVTFDHQFESASLTEAHRHCRCRDRVPDRATGHPAASPAGLLPLCSHRHGAGLHRTAPAIHQAAPPALATPLARGVHGLDPHRRSVVGHPPLPLVHRRARRAAARDPNPGPDQQETHEPAYKRPQAGPFCSDGGDTCGSDVLRAAVTAGHERSGQSLDVGKEA